MRHRVNWKRVPSQLQATGTILRQEPSKLNPCPTVCYVLVLTKVQGKGTLALQEKILPRLLKTIWQRKAVWKTLFQKKILRNYQPCVSTPKTPEQHKECVNQHCLIYHDSCPILYPATYEEHPMNNNDIHRVALAQHLLYHSKGEMLRREQSKGHRKGTRAWQKNIQRL